jgi:hypothetical protein
MSGLVRQKALETIEKMSQKERGMHDLGALAKVVYADRQRPDLILSDIQEISRARWAYLSHKGMIKSFSEKLGAYVVLV